MKDRTPGVRAHLEAVGQWLAENVRVYATPREVTLSGFEVDWERLSGSFELTLDNARLPERLRFHLDISGWLNFELPMFHSPLGTPASYAAVEFTPETREAITEGLRRTVPRVQGYGIVRATGREIGSSTPLAGRIVDYTEFEASKARASAADYAISVMTRLPPG